MLDQASRWCNWGEGDDVWLKSAMQHEMRFLNGFVDDVVEDDYTMPLARRIGMYVESLSSFFQSARIIGLPNSVVIEWRGPDDETTCPGCKYLFEHSPYTKFSLPTVPCACLCQCLTRCRDSLRVRQATEEEVGKVLESQKYTRDQHINNLRKLKRDGHL